MSGRPPWDFESFRLFIWSLKRHRYETAYIERKLEGYSPVLLETVEYAGARYPGFSVCPAKGDGERYRDVTPIYVRLAEAEVRLQK